MFSLKLHKIWKSCKVLIPINHHQQEKTLVGDIGMCPRPIDNLETYVCFCLNVQMCVLTFSIDNLRYENMYVLLTNMHYVGILKQFHFWWNSMKSTKFNKTLISQIHKKEKNQ